MNLSILIALLAFASLFGVIAGISKDRVYLVPMAGLLVLSSSMMLSSGSLMVQDGFTEQRIENTSASKLTERSGQYSNDNVTISSETDEFVDRTPRYEDVNQLYDWPFQFTTAFSILLLVIALYSFFLGADLRGTIRRS